MYLCGNIREQASQEDLRCKVVKPKSSATAIPGAKLIGVDNLSQSVPGVGWGKPMEEETSRIEEAPVATLRKIEPPKSEKKQTKSPAVIPSLHTEIYLRSMGDIFHLHSYELEGPVLLTILTSGDVCILHMSHSMITRII